MPKAARSGRDRRRSARRMEANLRAESGRARRPDFTQQYRRLRRRRLGAAIFVGIGLIVVVSHVFVHLANIEWLPLQDLLTGYPMGGMLIIIGLIMLGR